jgi:hypothetical protein
MIYTNDLQKLSDSWKERLSSNTQPSSYKDALSECIYELDNLICRSIEEEFSYKNFLEEADSHYSNIEPEELYAEVI